MTLAEAMVRNGGKTRFAGEAFNFSYGLRLQVVEVVQRILEAMKRPDLKPRILDEASNEIPTQCLNSKKAVEQLRWRPRHGFDEGLAMTIDWYRREFSGQPKAAI